MRILIYSYNYHPEPIGIAPLMTELAEGLVGRGHEVRVVTGMPNYPERQIYAGYRNKLYQTEWRNGVMIQRSYVWIRPKPTLLTRMLLDGSFIVTSVLQALRGWRPDVVLLTVPPLPVCVPAALLGWIYSCPVVLSLQDILPEAAVHLGLLRNKQAIRIFEALEQFAYHSANKVSVIADAFTENLVSKGVPQHKITCIPNWVDTGFVRPLPKVDNPFRKAHNLDGKYVVLYSGNIALTQGLETVIEAASLLQDIPEMVFVIVGEQMARHRLQAHCQRCGAKNVLLLDFQPREALPVMLAAADVGLIVQKRTVVSFNMPSKFQLLLASGRPIVASVPLNGAAAKAVRQSGGGVVTPPEEPGVLAESIRDLYADAERAARLAHQGRRYAVQHYGLEQALDQYELLFQEVVAQPQMVPAIAPVGSDLTVEVEKVGSQL